MLYSSATSGIENESDLEFSNMQFNLSNEYSRMGTAAPAAG